MLRAYEREVASPALRPTPIPLTAAKLRAAPRLAREFFDRDPRLLYSARPGSIERLGCRPGIERSDPVARAERIPSSPVAAANQGLEDLRDRPGSHGEVPR